MKERSILMLGDKTSFVQTDPQKGKLKWNRIRSTLFNFSQLRLFVWVDALEDTRETRYREQEGKHAKKTRNNTRPKRSHREGGWSECTLAVAVNRLPPNRLKSGECASFIFVRPSAWLVPSGSWLDHTTRAFLFSNAASGVWVMHRWRGAKWLHARRMFATHAPRRNGSRD